MRILLILLLLLIACKMGPNQEALKEQEQMRNAARQKYRELVNDGSSFSQEAEGLSKKAENLEQDVRDHLNNAYYDVKDQIDINSNKIETEKNIVEQQIRKTSKDVSNQIAEQGQAITEGIQKTKKQAKNAYEDWQEQDQKEDTKSQTEKQLNSIPLIPLP